ncbi:MAG: type II toxin-antitoxin system HicA family toxin [Candidatus Dojkabacteria bacterium]
MPQFKPIKRKKFEKFLVYIGCELKRTKGDHFIYTKPGLRRPIVITNNKDVPPFHIRTNLKTLNMTVKEFEEIMSRI